mmetsp:Transcript_3052/g.8842  ORF Transcript_3052/g.8842 Transcript_3052/m.8842 type:complete len:109 (-) Transcript_3052:69-395(-)
MGIPLGESTGPPDEDEEDEEEVESSSWCWLSGDKMTSLGAEGCILNPKPVTSAKPRAESGERGLFRPVEDGDVARCKPGLVAALPREFRLHPPPLLAALAGTAGDVVN